MADITSLPEVNPPLTEVNPPLTEVNPLTYLNKKNTLEQNLKLQRLYLRKNIGINKISG